MDYIDINIENVVYRLIDNQAKIVNSPDCCGHLIIPEYVTHENVSYPVTQVCTRSFGSYYKGAPIASIVLPKTLKLIDEEAFKYCAHLESVVIADGALLNKSIFSSCGKLKNVQLPSDLKVLPERIFRGCESLESIQLPNTIEEIGYEAFGGCINLKSIDLPIRLTKMGQSVFSSCHNLESINMTCNVTKLEGYTFLWCKSLKHIKLCDSLTSIGVNEFSGCSSIEEIIIPENVDFIGISAFAGCDNLKKITLPKNITRIGNFLTGKNFNIEFEGDCIHYMIHEKELYSKDGTMLFAINVKDDNGIYRIKEGVEEFTFSFSTCNSIKELIVPSSLKVIKESTFVDMAGLTSIVFEEGVEEISKNAIKDCANLETITLPSTIKKISTVGFVDCAIKKVIVPKKLASKVKTAFAKFNSLEIVFSDSDESVITDSKEIKEQKTKIALEKKKYEKENDSFEDVIKKLVKNTKKVDFIFEKDLPEVRFIDGTVAADIYLKACLLSYAKEGNTSLNTTSETLFKQLNKSDLTHFCCKILELFLNKIDNKIKWLYYFTSHASTSDILIYFKQHLTILCKNARSTLAVDAITALAYHNDKEVFNYIDYLSRTISHNRAIYQAENEVRLEANSLKLSIYDFKDSLIPNFNLNNNLTYNYGDRQFNVTYKDNSLKVIDNKGKEYKDLPKPGKNDNEDIANTCLLEYKDMKKMIKDTIKNQSQRLLDAMMFDKRWSIEKYTELFINNPIMQEFASSLIWGVYQEDELVQTFRYMDDGTFNNADEEEVKILDCTIGLIHPIEITKEEIDKWVTQLSDYELVQPFLQLEREIYLPNEDELKNAVITRFYDKKYGIYSFDNNLLNFNWKRDSVDGYGRFTSYYRNNLEDNYCVRIDFSGYSTLWPEDDHITINKIVFTQVKQISDINKKIFSEIIYQITKSTV